MRFNSSSLNLISKTDPNKNEALAEAAEEEQEAAALNLPIAKLDKAKSDDMKAKEEVRTTISLSITRIIFKRLIFSKDEQERTFRVSAKRFGRLLHILFVFHHGRHLVRHSERLDRLIPVRGRAGTYDCYRLLALNLVRPPS